MRYVRRCTSQPHLTWTSRAAAQGEDKNETGNNGALMVAWDPLPPTHPGQLRRAITAAENALEVDPDDYDIKCCVCRWKGQPLPARPQPSALTTEHIKRGQLATGCRPVYSATRQVVTTRANTSSCCAASHKT